ncbi:MAG: hypothetical protein M3Q97_06770, partial [Bacteroidota bacterium]|nr:hypothetical protein [Bacteroidota bacterium]
MDKERGIMKDTRLHSFKFSFLRMVGLVISFAAGFSANAQEIVVPLTHNAQTERAYANARLYNLAGSPDTLELPFFDDFVITKVHPSDSLWLDDLVHINSSIAIKSPSYNVATFDGLGRDGLPYDVNANL